MQARAIESRSLLTPSAWGALALLLAVANVFDVVATQIALARGAEEANPVALWLILSLGLSGLLVVKLALAGFLACGAWLARRREVDVLMLAACGGYTALALLHLQHLLGA